MLDPATTFDAVVTRHADPEQAAGILANPFYRNLADALPGTQEYMAAEKLYELTEDDRFDVVVVDTPPTRNAFAFIEAPATLTRFLDHRLYRLLMAPTRRMAKAASIATGAFIRTVSKVVGSEVVGDAVAFFQSFDGLEEGFRQRAHDVSARFRSPSTAFIVVTSPRRDALDEAEWFTDRLSNDGIEVRAVVVNRMQPPVDGPVDTFRRLTLDHPDTPLAALAQAVVDQDRRSRAERERLAHLLANHRNVPVVLIPVQGGDVRDLAGLTRIADAL